MVMQMLVAVVVARAVGGIPGPADAEEAQRRQQAQHQQHQPGGPDQGHQPGPDIVEGLAAAPQPHRHRPKGDQQHTAGLLLAHRSTTPATATAHRTATAKVRGAKRAANRRPNTPACMAISLTSTAGPTTRNTSRAVRENSRRLAATKASASEQMASNTASPPRANTDSTGWSATASSSERGTTTCRVA